MTDSAKRRADLLRLIADPACSDGERQNAIAALQKLIDTLVADATETKEHARTRHPVDESAAWRPPHPREWYNRHFPSREEAVQGQSVRSQRSVGVCPCCGSSPTPCGGHYTYCVDCYAAQDYYAHHASDAGFLRTCEYAKVSLHRYTHHMGLPQHPVALMWQDFLDGVLGKQVEKKPVPPIADLTAQRVVGRRRSDVP